MQNAKQTTVLAALALLCMSDAASGQERSIFQDIGDLIEQAVRPAPAAPPAPAANPANNNIKDLRRRRLDLNAQAMLAFVHSNCDLSKAQREKTQTVLSDMIDGSQRVWLRQPNRGGQNGNRDFSPIGFNRVARKVTNATKVRRGILDALNEDQDKQFLEAYESRDKALRHGLVSLALVTLDREMLLTKDQRKPTFEAIDSMLGNSAYAGLFGFGANSWPFQRANFGNSKSMKKVLGDIRYKRYQRLVKNNGNGDQYVYISMNQDGGTDSFQKAIDEQPARIAEAMAIRIEYLQQTKNISKKDVRRLQIAAKGAAKREIEKWIKSCEKQMDRMREQFVGQNVTWGMSLLRIDQIEKNKLWKTNVNKVLRIEAPMDDSSGPKTEAEARRQVKDFLDELLNAQKERKAKAEEPKSEREQFQQEALIDYTVAMLDQELWLRTDQRKKLRQLVADSMGDYEQYARYSSYYTELQMVADPLAVIPRKEVIELLDETQLEIWKLLRTEFRLDQAGPGNYATIVYEHGDLQFPLISRQQRRKQAKWPSEKGK